MGTRVPSGHFFLQHPSQMYSAIINTLPLNALSLDLFVVITGGGGGSQAQRPMKR